MAYEIRTFSSEHGVRVFMSDATERSVAIGQLPAHAGQVLSVQWRRVRAGRGGAIDIAWWCRELRTLVDAGMTVVEALETLAAQPMGAARAELHRALLASLHQGLALSEAMRRTGGFPTMLTAGVRAGERTGALVQALDDYLRYHQMLDGMRRRTVSAAIYPGLVLSLGLVISVFLLVYVMPRFAAVYQGHQGPLSLSTRGLIWVSDGLSAHWAWLLLATGGMIVLATAAARAGIVARAVAWLTDQLPPLRQFVDEYRLAKLYQSLALMFRGGYSLLEALQHCESLNIGVRMEASIQIAGKALQDGRGVAHALRHSALADETTWRLLAVGERSGNFDRVLQAIADRHAQRFEVGMERLTRVIEPLMLLAVSCVVGALVLMMYMPVFDIASSVR